MLKMMLEMRDRLKSRVGIYGTGFQTSSVMGLLLPFIIVLLLALIGYFFIEALQSMLQKVERYRNRVGHGVEELRHGICGEIPPADRPCQRAKKDAEGK